MLLYVYTSTLFYILYHSSKSFSTKHTPRVVQPKSAELICLLNALDQLKASIEYRRVSLHRFRKNCLYPARIARGDKYLGAINVTSHLRPFSFCHHLRVAGLVLCFCWLGI